MISLMGLVYDPHRGLLDGAPSVREGHRPSLLLVGAAVLVGGAPAIVPPLIASRSYLPLACVVGVLWLLLHIGCGPCAYRGRSVDVRRWVPATMAVVPWVLVPTLIGLVVVPGCLLWLIVATQSWHDPDDGGPGIVDRVREALRKTYG
jgi:hypothetical protein